MEERSSHLTIVVGASTIAEELRRSLVQHGVAHAGIASHVRGLRRSMVLGENDLVVVCIAMDRQTLTRHGTALRKLMADHRCFPQTIRSVGLLTEVGLNADAAELGCDVYVHDSSQAAKAVRSLARRWTTQNRAQSEARRSIKQAMADSKWDNQRDAWMWGTSDLPIEFVPVLGDRDMLGKSDSLIRSANRATTPSERRKANRHRRTEEN